MPTIKNFEEKNKSKKKKTNEATSKPAVETPESTTSEGEATAHEAKGSEASRVKRRPGRESSGESAGVDPESVVYVKTDLEEDHTQSESAIDHKADSQKSEEAQHSKTHSHTSANPHEGFTADEKIRIEFYGSELLRAQIPQVFDVAEAVATDWVKDGDFSDVPVGHPLAQKVVQEGLNRAKKVEKKLDDMGVIPLAKMGFELIRSKLRK